MFFLLFIFFHQVIFTEIYRISTEILNIEFYLSSFELLYYLYAHARTG